MKLSQQLPCMVVLSLCSKVTVLCVFTTHLPLTALGHVFTYCFSLLYNFSYIVFCVLEEKEPEESPSTFPLTEGEMAALRDGKDCTR